MSSTRNRPLLIAAVAILIAIFAATAVYTLYTANEGNTLSQQSTSTLAAASTSSSTTTSSGSSFVSESATTGTNGYSSSWLTYHENNERDGYDPNEPSISNSSSSPSVAWQSEALDGAIYAEPLVWGGMVYAATENNSVYALNVTTGQVAWKESLGTPVPGNTLPCGDIDPSGITGTPSIDPSLKLIFAVAYLYPPQHHVLFALHLNTGTIAFQRNVDPPGVEANVEQERGALGIANGMVYIPYGGLAGDCAQYHGFVLGIPENDSGSTLSYQVPTGREGGIWSPSGLSIDATGNIFVTTGNSESSNNFDFGNAVIRLSPALQEKDYFAPTNWIALNQGDTDLGSLAPSLLGNDTIFQIGKQGIGYLLNETHLGGIGGEEFHSSVCGGSFGGTAYVSPIVYVPCGAGLVSLKVDFSNGSFSILWKGPQFGASSPIVAGNALWTIDTGSAMIYALSRDNGTQLYSHSLGSVPHFATPSAADGYVFAVGGDAIYAFRI